MTKYKLALSFELVRKYLFILVLLFMCWSTCFAASPKYAEDWGFFWNKIELAYPMLPFLEKQGVSVTVLKEDSWNEIQSCTDDDSFLRVMRKVCAKMQGINHLRIMDSEELQRLMGPYLDIRRKEGKELFFDDLGVTSTEDKAEVASIRCSYISDSQIILIQIPAFSIEHMEADKKVLGSFLSEHSEATSIIFDVSSNTGGYGFYWQEVILPFFGGIWVDSVDVFFKDKDEVLVQFATGDFSEEDIKSVEVLSDKPEFVIEYGLNWFYTSIISFDFGEGILPNADRFIITSALTYSSADAFAAFARRTGWATLVGDPTGGSGDGDSLYYVLPNTHFVLRFSPFVSSNTSGMANSAYGTIPNIPTARKSTPIRTCFDMIQASYAKTGVRDIL